MNIWKYLTNERGQVAYNSGGLWSGIGQGLAQLGQNIIQGRKLKEQQKTLDLRNKMLQMQIDEANQAHQARQALVQSLTNPEPIQEPSIIGGPVQGPYTETGQPPAAPPQYTTRPATIEDLRKNPAFLANLANADTKDFTNKILANMFPTGAQANNPHNAVLAPGGQLVSPEGKVLAENKNQRTGLGANSKIFAQIEAENPGADLETKLTLYNQALQGQATARGFGGAVGAGQGREQVPVPLGKEAKMARFGAGGMEMAPANATPAQLRAGGFRTVENNVLESLQALAPAQQALKEFNSQAEQLAKESEGIVGSASNAAGALPGLLGATAQRFGASNTGDNLKAATLNFFQHYDKVVGGVRGASSPQLLQIMENRAPQAGQTPQQIRNRQRYINDVFHAMQAELQNVVQGKAPNPENVSRAIMRNPDASYYPTPSGGQSGQSRTPPPPPGWRRAQ